MKRRHLRRGTNAALLLGIAVLLLVIFSASVILYTKRHILGHLSGQEDIVQTVVYSRPLVLDPKAPVSESYVAAWLNGLGWKKTTEEPRHPKEFGQMGTTWRINSATQRLKITFKNNLLATLEDNDTRQPLPSAEIEPKVLARWTETPDATRPRIQLSELPAYVPQAVLAIEDRRFYEHPGVDVVGLVRAVWADLRHRDFIQGGSTISQQLARSVFLNTDRTMKRKLLEIAIALYLETRYSKDKLLEMYLNQVYWGRDGGQNLLGIASASQAFFGKPATNLTLAEAAMLAGLLQSPNRYSPRTRMETAMSRRALVLSLMQDQKRISKIEQKRALGQKIRLEPPSMQGDEAAYFVTMIADSLVEDYGAASLGNQSWSIYTTLDPVLQHAAVAALKPPRGEAALVALDAQSGAIRVWVGGSGFRLSPFDRARHARRQPGSAFKPIVAAAALEDTIATTATVLDDKPMSLQAGEKRGDRKTTITPFAGLPFSGMRWSTHSTFR